jgi:RHH-type proline utilization regulon transcriptional repressor/proline dehydrogenase/delta 1-pyrroline-5-carboxylate dehydrogenase
LRNTADIRLYDAARQKFAASQWQAALTINPEQDGEVVSIVNPANPDDVVGVVIQADKAGVEASVKAAKPWSEPVQKRSQILCAAADLFEKSSGEIFALLAREAGKTPVDAVAELREAVDFLRYYAHEATNHADRTPCGIFACISPWNFPLAIFTGQISAALATGNAVLAKPAETTPLIAALAVRLLHEAGVPSTALQLVPGTGPIVGGALTSDPRISGVCFTGSTATAQTINRAMAQNLSPHAPLIAETGGINAMIVDSTALAEQAVRDIVASAFQSAGQRCSALRVLYVQKDIADHVLTMLYGAMDELVVANPWCFNTDLGPVIDHNAKAAISEYCQITKEQGRVLKQVPCPPDGNFVPPTVISIDGIEQLAREIFGPVLHVATFEANEIDAVLDAVNSTGFGLTFGLHTRINDRVDHIALRIRVGNFYVNRNQIGAVVGSQPFGGEGLSGTGPKAGGPHYLARFCYETYNNEQSVSGEVLAFKGVQQAIDVAESEKRGFEPPLHTTDMPGPTGEKNQLSEYPRGLVLCLGPTLANAQEQAEIARSKGCPALIVAPGAIGEQALSGVMSPDDLTRLTGFAAVAYWGEESAATAIRQALAARDGALVPLLSSKEMGRWCQVERHICVDTTAAGGNASLLSAGL